VSVTKPSLQKFGHAPEIFERNPEQASRHRTMHELDGQRYLLLA
jgi:hypothetical protein